MSELFDFIWELFATIPTRASFIYLTPSILEMHATVVIT